MANRTPVEGMEEAAKGMTNKQVREDLERLNKMEERTLGQETARKVLENEWNRRNGGQS